MSYSSKIKISFSYLPHLYKAWQPKTFQFFWIAKKKWIWIEVFHLQFRGNRILIHVHIILVNGRHNEVVALWLHPCRHKWGKVQPWVAIQHQFIVYDLVCGLLWYRGIWQPEPNTFPSSWRILKKSNKINLKLLGRNY